MQLVVCGLSCVVVGCRLSLSVVCCVLFDVPVFVGRRLMYVVCCSLCYVCLLPAARCMLFVL